MLSGEKPIVMNQFTQTLALRKTDLILPLAKLKAIKLSIIVILATASLLACQSGTSTEQAKTPDFERITPKYAKGFALDQYPEFQILHILRPFNDKADTLSYLLLPKGTKKPEGFSQLATIQTPIENFVTLSTTHVALADLLDATPKIIGLSSAEYVCNEKIRNRLANNTITQIGDGETLNQEQVLSLNPSLVMVSGFSQASFERSYRPILELGIPVLVNSEWMEETMLGRTEWVKVLGYLLDDTELANRKFEEVESKYLALAKMGRNAAHKPLVIGGLPFKGTWSVAGSKSYISNLLTDAGATWNWANDSTSTSIQMDFESVYPIGIKAEYWLRAGTTQSKEALLAIDSRFADFKAFQSGNIFNNNKRISPNGMGYDYWESGIINPHLILGDLIQILHPELMPSDTLFYYQRLK